MSQGDEGKSLYQEQLIKLSRHPYGYKVMESYTCHSRAHNRMCGDVVDIYLVLADGLVAEASFSGESCAVCKASASLMIQAIEGLPIEDCKDYGKDFERFKSTWDSEPPIPEMMALSVMKDFPSRERCLTLPWEALGKALESLSAENAKEKSWK